VDKIIAILDTNIYISSIFWKGQPYKIVKKCLEERFNAFLTEEIIIELRRALKRDFNVNDEKMSEIIDGICLFAQKIQSTYKVNIVKDDPADNIIIQCALSSNANYIVTQDKHLLRIKEHKNIKIINPSEFLALL